LALFIWLIIRLIQLVFSAGTVFFSHKKSGNSVFQSAYNFSRTAPLTAHCVHARLLALARMIEICSAGWVREARACPRVKAHGEQHLL
jgi:hypothetical protein